MSAAGHERWADSTGAYLLGALPPEELDDFERHLETCAECRNEIDHLRMAVDALPASAPPVDPPAALRERIMTIVRSEAQLLSAAGERADRPEVAPEPVAPADEPERRRGGWLGGLFSRPALATGLAVALLALGAVGGVLLGGGGGGDDPAAQPRTVTAQVDRNAAPRARVTLEIDDASRGVLVGEGMPAPPRGRIYQVWLLRPGAAGPEPTPALFGVRGDGSATVTVPGDLSGVSEVLVTHEPLGGSDVPTRTPILSAPIGA